MAVILRDADILAEWEDFMASIANSLRIKFGLTYEPTETKAGEWARLTQQFIDRGQSREDAGNQAARQLFTDYRTKTYAGEADTIEYLLQQVGHKK